METKTQTLQFNSEDYPLSQFTAVCGDEMDIAPGLPTESDMRREAIKYIGRNALPVMGRLTVRMGAAVVRGVRYSIDNVGN